MNWEYIGWFALAISGAVIAASFFVAHKPAIIVDGSMVVGTGTVHPLHAWLEIAWPVFFIAIMGMLTLKEVMGFAAVLLLATVITGVIWVADHILFRNTRADGAEPVVVEMARSFFPVILIVFFLRSFLYEPFKIPSESMVPTLHVGDFILVNNFSYGVRLPVINKKIVELGNPRHGDVMVFRYPEDPAKDFIKRVVGIPGDKIAYVQKRLTVNGKLIELENLGTATEIGRGGFRRFESFREKFDGKIHTIQQDPDMVGVRLGGVRQFPNRENCEYNNDGVTCTVPAGHYFMMGDNRDNSDDSRYWGFVPEGNIVGKAVLIWMNFSNFKRIFNTIE